ncbi:putative T7SS-secreted protein [Alloscardovia venturai]|uniref:T7SS-secreted protein n=1 Tax=Alloscardovia venturai TaxID=1769421 RepID=A0ABW2Y3B4_9BIFI
MAGRPSDSDWITYGDQIGDPTPGKPDDIEQFGQSLQSKSKILVEMGEYMSSIENSAKNSALKGKAATELAKSFNGLPAKLGKLGTNTQSAGKSLCAWASGVKSMQKTADKALEDAKKAAASVKSAQDAVSSASSSLRVEQAKNFFDLGGSDEKVNSARQKFNNAESTLNAAQDALKTAKKTIADTKDEYDTEARKIAGKIQQFQEDAGIKLTVWQKIKYSQTWKNIVKVGKVVGTVAAVASLFIPGANLVVAGGLLLSSTIALGDTMLDYANGDADAGDVFLAAASFGLDLLGMGAAVGSCKSVLKGAEAAGELSKGTRLKAALGMKNSESVTSVMKNTVMEKGGKAVDTVRKQYSNLSNDINTFRTVKNETGSILKGTWATAKGQGARALEDAGKKFSDIKNDIRGIHNASSTYEKANAVYKTTSDLKDVVDMSSKPNEVRDSVRDFQYHNIYENTGTTLKTVSGSMVKKVLPQGIDGVSDMMTDSANNQLDGFIDKATKNVNNDFTPAPHHIY